MSIFVSICCLGIDTELIKTVRSAKDNASNQEDIHIGIAFIGNKKFYDNILEDIGHYSNIVTSFNELKGNLGVGRGRSLATSLYDNQDYFLQVDAHTFFMQDWDTFLIEKLKVACKETNNEKTVLSGFPGSYGYVDDEGNNLFWVDPRGGYPGYLKDTYCLTSDNFAGIKLNRFKTYKNLIPKWNPINNEEILNAMYLENNFIPLVKISAAFMFGNSLFANYTGLEERSKFWEEEILQSINLINEGFSLVFSGPYSPINHFYSEDKRDHRGTREFYTDYAVSEDLHMDIGIHLMDYVRNNKKKVKRYNKYIGFDILKSPKNSDFFKPKRYSKLKPIN
jgi:hypothetical protein